MLSKELIKHIENLLSEKVIQIVPLSGGDINKVYQLSTNGRKLVIKLNSSSGFPGMFEAETKGLNELRNSNTFTIPDVLHFGEYNDDAFLVLEYIETGKKAKDFWKKFGQRLANLHKNGKPYFGFDTNNYIGSLPQYNSKCNSAAEFYITERLQPQLKLAFQKGFLFPDVAIFYKTIESEIPDEPSSLIHGDLWNGNFLIDTKGLPCLIDPAVSYAPREMDIAMMQLFGGFNPELYEVYNKVFPFTENWKDRLPIWQLYYLLVHLNLFGSSYYKRVKEIVDRYL